MNSREKGKRGERQWRDELRANGYPARRGQQFAGGNESPDVICDELDWIHFEVKAVERLNIEDAMDQARRDCGVRSVECGVTEREKIPVVAHKRSHRRWLVTMEAEFFFELIREFTPQRHRDTEVGSARRVALGQSGDVSPHSKVTRPTKNNLGETPEITRVTRVLQEQTK